MTRFSLIILRPFGVASVLCLLFAGVVRAQNTGKVAEWLETSRLSGSFQPVRLFSIAQERADLQSTVENATILEPDPAAFDQILAATPLTISLSIPNAYGDIFELELVKVDLLAPEFTVGALGMNPRENVPMRNGVHYRGIVRGSPRSLAALSVFDDDVMAMISDETGTYQIGKLEDGSGQYLLCGKEDLKAAPSFTCFSDDDAVMPGDEVVVEDRGVGCKTVQVYFECDYKLYTDKGSSTTNVTNYVTGLFNQVAALYANENVGIAISQIYVWTSPDPYQSYSTTSSVLNAFRSTRGTNFTGNLAHFLSTRNLGGGIAYLDVICFKSYAFGVSAISASYQNVPTYSWSVEVVTHELGHNLGAWHTHSCNWPGGALDNCYTPEGSCSSGPAPSNGGTIMSYCHLTSYGINFSNGFGSIPGNHIRNKVLAATCLTASGTAPAGLSTTNITNSSASLSWGGVAGATTYTVQYKAATSSAWLTAGNTTSTGYNLNGLSANTAYNWQVKTDCSNYSAAANFTTTNSSGGTACSAPGGQTTTNITTSSAKFNWGTVSGASNYTVQYKTSSSSTWLTAGTTAANTYTINSLNASTGYNWRVKANCSSGYSTAVTFTTLTGSGGGSGCSTPVNLTNNSVQATKAVISWSPVSGASNYTIQIKFASSGNYYTLGTVPVTQVTISGLQPSTAYHWRVKANCSAYSTEKLLTTPAGLQSDAASAMPDIAIGYLQLYPNPATESLLLHYNGDMLPGNEVLITDLAGRILLQQPITQERQQIDVSRLQAGLYALVLMEGGKRVTAERFVKM